VSDIERNRRTCPPDILRAYLALQTHDGLGPRSYVEALQACLLVLESRLRAAGPPERDRPAARRS
jgi:hypothetical protein